MRRARVVSLLLLSSVGCWDNDGSMVVRDAGVPPHFVDGGPGSISGRLGRSPTTRSAEALGPIIGGTLLVLPSEGLAVVADPDRDQIALVDVAAASVVRTLALQPGDQPGRSAAIGARVATVLRGAGALAVYAPRTGEVQRVPVCLEPRGIAHDAALDATYVACMTGELVTLGDGATRVVAVRHVDVDLRDVWIEGDELRITRFRSAEVIATDRAGVEHTRRVPPSLPLPRAAPAPDAGTGSFARSSPTVAWRAAPLPSGGAVLTHQRAQEDPVVPSPGGYGASQGCGGGIVTSVLAIVDASGHVRAGPPIMGGVLPVDVAVSPDERWVAVALAGSGEGAGALIFDRGEVARAAPDGCGPSPFDAVFELDNEVVAVAFGAGGERLAQLRDPAGLQIDGRTVSLSPRRATDTGHTIFHINAGAGIACASCHPEGGEDGHVWDFVGIGQRRTQSLLGGLAGSEPFHWDGDMRDLTTLTHEVFSSRMGGPVLDGAQIGALEQWLERLPLPRSPVARDLAAVERGRALFNRTDVGCATCHGGARFQGPGSFDVGTGAEVQVPSLRGVVYRAPLMHSGCAPDLAARFGACGGGDRHGVTSMLGAEAIADLVQYLETL